MLLSMKLLVLILLTPLLIYIVIVDIRSHRIPNLTNALVLTLGILAAALTHDLSLLSRIAGFFVMSVPLLIFANITPRSFGGGDIKLTAAAGFLLGAQGIISAMLIASLTSAVFALFLLLRKKAKCNSHFAFGPFLAVGIFITSAISNIPLPS